MEQMQKTAELQAMTALLTQLRETPEPANDHRDRRVKKVQAAIIVELSKVFPPSVVKTISEEFPS